MSKYKKGFTLIELLVVISIMGMLSSVVISSLQTTREKAENAKQKIAMSQWVTAFEMAKDRDGVYPGVYPYNSDGTKQFFNDCGSGGLSFGQTTGVVSLFRYVNNALSSSFSLGACSSGTTASRDHLLNTISQFYSNPTTYYWASGGSPPISGPSFRILPPCSYAVAGGLITSQTPSGCTDNVQLKWNLKGDTSCGAGLVKEYNSTLGYTICSANMYAN